MDRLRVAHVIDDLLQGVQPQGKFPRVVGDGPPLPPLHPQQPVEPGLPWPGLKPLPPVVVDFAEEDPEDNRGKKADEHVLDHHCRGDQPGGGPAPADGAPGTAEDHAANQARSHDQQQYISRLYPVSHFLLSLLSCVLPPVYHNGQSAARVRKRSRLTFGLQYVILKSAYNL